MDEQSVEKAIVERGIKDKVSEIYGPSQLAESVVWEVWVKDRDDEFATRFLEEFSDNRYKIYDTFQGLSVRLNKQHELAVSAAKDIEWKRSRDLADIEAARAAQAAEASNRLIEIQAKSSVQAASLSNARIEHLLKMSMVGGGFFVGLCIATYLVALDKPYSGWAAGFIFLCLVASAGKWAYGEWVTPELPGERHS